MSAWWAICYKENFYVYMCEPKKLSICALHYPASELCTLTPGSCS